ncbi:MAG: hypothetical protein HQ581_13075 [Planctomycetes bacterium]|nr:hypothetical protein [Planctomycetota bacterium]
MASSRTTQLNKLCKVLKKEYKPVVSSIERPVFEHLLFACCLEDAHYDVAEEALAAVVEAFFDLNEVRVSTVKELAEVMAVLPDPSAAANRLKRVLQSTFEDSYTFELEALLKLNLGPAVEHLRAIDGTSNFSIAYVVQTALAGHAIAIDSGTLGCLQVVGLVSEKDIEAGVVSGLERAISKSNGVEFASLLHQLGADFTKNPYAPELHRILLQIAPDCKDRLPKRRGRKQASSAKQDAEADAESKLTASKGKGSETKKKAGEPSKKPAAAEKKSSAAKQKSPPSKGKKASGSSKIAPRKPR